MNKPIMEFLGTLVLAFTVVSTTVNPEASAMAPFAIGLALAIMIYAGGHISGAHYNPAVTLAATIRGAHPKKDVITYLIAQVVGAIAGALIALNLKTNPAVQMLAPNIAPALIAEILITSMLAFVVLQTATVKSVEGNSYYGLCIGGTVSTGALAVGGVSGGVFNPAIAVALLVIGVLPSGTCLVYIAAQLVAGALAAVLFKITATASSRDNRGAQDGRDSERRRANA